MKYIGCLANLNWHTGLNPEVKWSLPKFPHYTPYLVDEMGIDYQNGFINWIFRADDCKKMQLFPKIVQFWPTETKSNPVLVFSNIIWSAGGQKYLFYTFNNKFDKFGWFLANFGKLDPIK